MTREPFTIEEIKALLYVSDDTWKAMILLGSYAGLRLTDAASLTWRNVDFDKNKIVYLPRKTSRLANATTLKPDMHPDIEKVLLRLPVESRSPDAPIFSSLVKIGT